MVLHILVGDEDLPAVDNLSQWHRLVGLPVSDGLSRLHEDDKVISLALVVDLDLGVAAVHCDVVWGYGWDFGWVTKALK